MLMANRYKETQLTEAARESRNAASREWRRKNKERVQEYNRRYWERRAERERKAERERNGKE